MSYVRIRLKNIEKTLNINQPKREPIFCIIQGFDTDGLFINKQEEESYIKYMEQKVLKENPELPFYAIMFSKEEILKHLEEFRNTMKSI